MMCITSNCKHLHVHSVWLKSAYLAKSGFNPIKRKVIVKKPIACPVFSQHSSHCSAEVNTNSTYLLLNNYSLTLDPVQSAEVQQRIKQRSALITPSIPSLVLQITLGQS